MRILYFPGAVAMWGLSAWHEKNEAYQQYSGTPATCPCDDDSISDISTSYDRK
jgi:hypothetical protein